jgi:agmatinase
MANYYIENCPRNFGFLKNQKLDSAKIIIIPTAYEGTIVGNGGSKGGPRAIIEASAQIDEIWGERKKWEDAGKIYTLDEIELSLDSPKGAIDSLINFLGRNVGKGRIPLILGGEHLLALASVKFLKEKYKNFSVLQLDAHLDLRDEYAGAKYSHATVMRRISELGISVTAVGARSVDLDTLDYIKQAKVKNIFYAPALPVKEIIKSLSENVYLSIDLDVFDPSIMPSVSSPQPGGLGWQGVLDLIKAATKKNNIIGVDVVELCPIPGFAAPDVLTAKLVYKIIEYILN